MTCVFRHRRFGRAFAQVGHARPRGWAAAIALAEGPAGRTPWATGWRPSNSCRTQSLSRELHFALREWQAADKGRASRRAPKATATDQASSGFFTASMVRVEAASPRAISIRRGFSASGVSRTRSI